MMFRFGERLFTWRATRPCDVVASPGDREMENIRRVCIIMRACVSPNVLEMESNIRADKPD